MFNQKILEITGRIIIITKKKKINILCFIKICCSCVADNSLGRAKKYMEVSGRPGPAEFISAPWSRSPESYNLTWKVDSYPPLQEVRLLYRKLMVRIVVLGN